MKYHTIVFDKEERVAVITLNRPEKLNAVTRMMIDELKDALEKVEIDDEIRVIPTPGHSHQDISVIAETDGGVIAVVGDLFENHKCIEIESDYGSAICLPRLIYCVSFVKHILGINNPFILTPYQLYCELIKRGGKPIFESIEGETNGIHETKDVYAAT